MRRSIPVKDFTFGSGCWPGLAKFTEECGEALHEIGKLMGNTDDEVLIENLEEELADVIAAARVVIKLNPDLSGKGIEKRIKQKMAKHLAKHKERANGNVCEDN